MTHVAVDLDDCILNFRERVLKCYNKEFGTDYEVSDALKWEVRAENFEKGDPYEGWWPWWRDRAHLWATCEAIDGAIHGLRLLRDRGNRRVEIVTSTPDWARWAKWKWCEKWRPDVDGITFVPMDEKKSDYTDADILIDDNPKNIEDFLSTDRKAILFNQPWNQDFFYPYRARRWSDVVIMVEGIESIEVTDFGDTVSRYMRRGY